MLAILLLMIDQGILNHNIQRKDIFFRSIVIWNFWSLGLVETLSYLKCLNTNSLMICWGILDVMLFLVLIFRLRHKKIEIRKPKKILWNQIQLYQVLIGVTGGIVFLLSLLTVPYNWDSMTYRLPRIMHWAQNQSVAHFAANDVRQLASPVLAEFINVQVYLLSGRKDIFFNVLQSASYLIDAWIIYEISIKIGAQKKYAGLSALLFMTMPIAFSEALNTQVDLFATLWLLIFVYYYVDFWETDEIVFDQDTVTKCMMMASCVSMGYLAKPSVNIGMAFLLVFLCVKCLLRRDSWRYLVRLVLVALPFALLPLIPEWMRNYQTFSALGDPQVGARQIVGTIKPNYVLMNLIKNFAQNWPNIYLYDSAEWMAKIVMVIATVLRVDINDPSISEDGREYVMNAAPTYNHDSAINPVVVITACICFIWCIVRWKNRKDRGARYTIYTMTIFILFCAIVRWEPFVTRYMLAYLALLCPAIGYQVQTISMECKKESMQTAFISILYFLCFTELFSLTRFHQELWHEEASKRPIGYFAYNKAIRPEYEEVFLWLKDSGYQTIGIKVGNMNYEYPMWIMFENPNLRIESVLVENQSAKYEDMQYIPDCLIMDLNKAGNEVMVHGQLYSRATEFLENEHLAVYLKGINDENLQSDLWN